MAAGLAILAAMTPAAEARPLDSYTEPVRLSRRALGTPEPLVRTFARRVQQEGALDLTQGDYKNADFAPHAEVVRAAQRITRNSVHSYGPAVGRLDVRAEIAALVNRDGARDYPGTSVRFLPDEVIFTPGTRAGLAAILEVLGEDGSGVIVPRPSWEYDWFVERAGKHVVELPMSAPHFEPDPDALRHLLARGGISSIILNNPHNPTGRVFPRELVEEIVSIAVEHGVYVLYDAVYQRLDYVDAFVNPAFANREWRDRVVLLSGLSKMDMFGASTGARACWMVLSDGIREGGIRARDVVANLSAWLIATPSTLAQDWALAALQSPLAALRRPSPQMRARRDFMITAADALSHLRVERTDCGGTFYAPLAFPGLVGESFDRLRNGVWERAVVRTSEDAFELLLAGGVGGIPFAAFAGSNSARYGTWQRLSYGSKDVGELAVFMERVQTCIEKQGRLGSSAMRVHLLDELSADGWTRRRIDRVPLRTLRITGTKHPDSTTHREEQLRLALLASPGEDATRAERVLKVLDWNPLVDAQHELDETVADLLGPCTEVLVDYEGRQISPEWLELPERIVLELLQRGIIPGEDRHLLVRVPNPYLEQDEEKIARILGAIARANFVFHLACERLGIAPQQNAIHELTVPQINAKSDLGALQKIESMYGEAVDGIFENDRFLAARIPVSRRDTLSTTVRRVRLVPLVENVGALAHLPRLLDGSDITRVFIAMSDTAESSGKIATDAAFALAAASKPEHVAFLVGAGRAGFRGGFDPEHRGVLRQFARVEGVTLQGIRADAPELAQQLADEFLAARGVSAAASPLALSLGDRQALLSLMHRGVAAHTAMLLRIAPLISPFNGLVPQTRVRIRATGSVSYGRSIPEYPEEWGAGFPDARDLREAWPEGVSLPRAINFNLACTTLGLPAVVSDLAVVDERAALLFDRHVPGYREVLRDELPYFVPEAVALIFGCAIADEVGTHCRSAATALSLEIETPPMLVAPVCHFAMLYLRYLAEDSDSWDETKEHESTATREEELIRETGTDAFLTLCADRPGQRWPALQRLMPSDDAVRLLLSRELTRDEKRKCVEYRIDAWLRTLRQSLTTVLRREWASSRAAAPAGVTLEAIEAMIALERLRGGRGA